MKKVILIIAIATSSLSAQQLDNIITDDDEVLFNYVEKIVSTVANSIAGAIQFFEGADGCGDDGDWCIVLPFTPFSWFWGVDNVGDCIGSNTANHPSFMGLLQPFGGGSGDFSTTIVGGLGPDENWPVTFTIECDIVTFSNYTGKIITSETSSIIIPADVYMMLRVVQGETFLINVVENAQATIKMNRPFQSIGNKKWYSEVYVKNKTDSDFNLSINISNIQKAYNHDKIWLVLTEYDPRKSILTSIYDHGKCDSLAQDPAINFSTHSMLEAKLGECILEPDVEYFITKIYFKDV